MCRKDSDVGVFEAVAQADYLYSVSELAVLVYVNGQFEGFSSA